VDKRLPDVLLLVLGAGRVTTLSGEGSDQSEKGAERGSKIPILGRFNMGAALFRKLRRDYIEKACRDILESGVPRNREAKSAFVFFKRKWLPAKYVLERAYEIRYRRRLPADSHTGGLAALSILKRMGLSVKYVKGIGRNGAFATRRKGAIKERVSKKADSRMIRKAIFSVVTVDVRGKPAKSERSNRIRMRLLEKLETVLNDRSLLTRRPDLILLPGGFLYSNSHIGPLSDQKRFRRIASKPLSKACARLSAGTSSLVVAGVDGADDERTHSVECFPSWPDQLCVAWNKKGVVGIGRKIFPAPKGPKEDIEDSEPSNLLVYKSDFESTARVVRYRGMKILLCACYDVYGCSVGAPEGDNSPLGHVKHLDIRGKLLTRGSGRNPMFRKGLQEGAEKWRKLVNEADLVLGSIHQIEKGGSISKWQRNGFKRRAGVNSGIAFIGAAHYRKIKFAGDGKSRFAVCKHGSKVRCLKPSEIYRSKSLFVRLYRKGVDNKWEI
jgi:hypothetical protein